MISIPPELARDWMTTADLKQRLQVSDRTIWRLIASGVFGKPDKFTKYTLVRREAVDRFMKQWS